MTVGMRGEVVDTSGETTDAGTIEDTTGKPHADEVYPYLGTVPKIRGKDRS